MMPMVACVASVVMGGAVLAEEVTKPAPDSTTTAAEASDDDTVSCRRIKEVGSNLGKKKVCMTRAEWAKLNDDSRQFDRDVEDPEPFYPKDGQPIGPVR
jgi:hypothetical protein